MDTGVPPPVAAASNLVTVNTDKKVCSSPLQKGSERANAAAGGPTLSTTRAILDVFEGGGSRRKESRCGVGSGPTLSSQPLPRESAIFEGGEATNDSPAMQDNQDESPTQVTLSSEQEPATKETDDGNDAGQTRFVSVRGGIVQEANHSSSPRETLSSSVQSSSQDGGSSVSNRNDDKKAKAVHGLAFPPAIDPTLAEREERPEKTLTNPAVGSRGRNVRSGKSGAALRDVPRPNDTTVLLPGAYHIPRVAPGSDRGVITTGAATEEDFVGAVEHEQHVGSEEDSVSAQLGQRQELQLLRGQLLPVQGTATAASSARARARSDFAEGVSANSYEKKCKLCRFGFAKQSNPIMAVVIVIMLAAGYATSMLSALVLLTPETQAKSPVLTTDAMVTFAATAPPTQPSSSPVTPAPIALVHVAQWVQVGDDIDAQNIFDQSVWSVALSSTGAVLAIGAIGGRNNAGHVLTYTNASGGWEQWGSDLDGGYEFGSAVSLSADGTILAVGARWAQGVNGFDSGRVYVHQWIGNAWQPLGSTLDGVGVDDSFGLSLALSNDGTILAVGALGNGAGGREAGRVQVFKWTGTDWSQRGNDLNGSSPGDHFGDSVSLSADGSIVACGADQEDTIGPGYVRIYRWSGSVWQHQGSPLVGFSSGDQFGESISLSGDGSTVAVGANFGNYAAMYRNDGVDWDQAGQTIRGGSSGDEFGFSVSLSFDGKTVLISGPQSHTNNGVRSGHALVFRLSPNGQEWMQVGQKLVGEVSFEYFGVSTAISEDGHRIAIGTLGDDAGHVRVYDLQ